MNLESLDEEWNRAQDHARRDGLDTSNCHLFPFDFPAPPDSDRAKWLKPGTTLYVEPDFPADDEMLMRVNSDAVLQGHRITIFKEKDRRLLLGALRHELEHARQWQWYGEPGYRLRNFLLQACSIAAEAHRGGLIYNALPTEQDANAAASHLLRSVLEKPEIEELVHDDAGIALVRWKGPREPIESLPIRMLSFARLHLNAVEECARVSGHKGITDFLAQEWPDLVGAWRGMVSTSWP